ncbi:S-adenosyl-L-methionine-dependent methyltransferase [Marasmius fiardii PR-910]|nr:S-adenosyl-L-methionine-dependent methyltransferase [Marasmius fiardii PR-910]
MTITPLIPTGDPTIDSLLSLIYSSTRAAVAEYQKTGGGVVPSPDDPIFHPLDSASDSSVLALKKAIRVLEGACERLCTTLAQPMHTIANVSFRAPPSGVLTPPLSFFVYQRSMPYEAPCLRLAVQNGIADLLEGHPEGLQVDYISWKTGLDSRKLRQVLRLLATRGCFREVAENVFANNRLSLTLLSSNPVSAAVMLDTGECLRAVNALPEALSDPEFAFSREVDKTAFTYAISTGGGTRDKMEKGKHEAGLSLSLFDWYKQNPQVAQRFDRAMMGWSMITGSVAIVNHFQWEKMSPGTTFCDIGSGVGTIPLSIAKAHPHLRITLQDLPEPLEQAKFVWSTELPEALKSGNERIQFIPLDFLKAVPVVGQDVYYMKHILHDWPDAEAITILQHVANAMGLHSRLLVHDFVLKHVYSDDTDHSNAGDRNHARIERAPLPLLPNYGTGNIRHYNQDINMLAVCNSKERTCEEYSALGAEVGLELMKVWDLAETYVLEFRLLS